MRAKLVNARSSLGPRDPAAVTRPRRCAPIKRLCRFVRDMWATERHRRTKTGVLAPCRDRERVVVVDNVDRNAGVDELQQPLAGSMRRWIVGQDHDAPHTCSDQRVGARGCAALVRAGLERYVDRGIARTLLRDIKRHRFGMRLAWTDMPTLSDHRAVPRNHAPDERIRRSCARTALGQLQRTGEQ